MSVLSGKTVEKLKIMEPYCKRTRHSNGMTYGGGSSSYDCRIDVGPDNVTKQIVIRPGKFKLAATMEKFKMPKNVCGFVKDKSTYARMGLSVFNTFIDPGWEGYLTIEIANHGDSTITLTQGEPICQIVFMFTDEETEGYEGKYQNQKRGAVPAKRDKTK
jgi:dCTP deaminase